jgi:uncharacterized protein (DUF58 family)
VIPEELLREVRRIELTTRELVRDLVAGDYASAFRGRGVEFAEVREYLPGDDVRSIDWNVTARLGTPYVKRFQEERQLSLILLVDVSASGGFGSVDRTKRQLAAEIAAVLSLTATRHRDRVGAAFYSNGVEWFSPPKSGRSQALQLVTKVLAYEPEDRGTDLLAALDFLEPLLRRRALVAVLSDFLDQSQWPALDRLAWRHDVVAVQLSDPRERELPPVGLVTLWEPESGDWQVVDADDPGVREQFREQRAAFDAGLGRHCIGRGVDLLRLDTDQPYGERLAAFFSRRQLRRV